MKRVLLSVLATLSLFFLFPQAALAASTSSDMTNFVQTTLGYITAVGSVAAIFFVVKGGLQYMTSTGSPEGIESAKKTIKNALLGLLIILSASFVVNIFNQAYNGPGGGGSETVSIPQIESAKPSDGLTQVLLDAIAGVLQNLIESAVKPVVDGIIVYLTTTPSLMGNSVVLKFWLVNLGITNSLFLLVIALVGLHFMSASSFGFEEAELKQLLPRVGLAFLGANSSLFLADYVVQTCNVMVKTVIDQTGGLTSAWVLNAVNPVTFLTGNTPLITLVFLVIFLIAAIVLLLIYVSRLIFIFLGAVMSPLIFLLWAMPKTADFASAAFKTYFVTVFMAFVHVVIFQLAASFLTLPGNTTNSLVSIAVAIGLFFTLLKVPSVMMQLVLYSSGTTIFKRVSGQIMNAVMAPKQDGSGAGSSDGSNAGKAAAGAKKARVALGV